MVRFTKNDYVDADRCEERLRRDGFICFDRKYVEQIMPFYQTHADTCANLARDLMIYRSGGQYGILKRECIANYLMRVEGCPPQYFSTKKTEGVSIEMKNVLTKLQANGFANEFFEYYFEHRTWDNKCSKLKKLAKECTEYAGTNKYGVDLYKIPFDVNRQKNRRFNYKNYDIIAQIPKEVCNCISVEDGYFLAWGDFAQSDFRIAYNLFLRSEKNDEIMNLYDDKYEALARIVADTDSTKFDLETFKKERPLYKRLTLATIYGIRSSVVKEEQMFIQSFTRFLEKCPRYKEYCRRLDKRIQLNLPIILTSYFGWQEQINVYGTYKTHIMDDALNCPIQTGTSEIVILVINSILDTFYDMGFTDDDVRVYYNRHDEPIFKVKETMLPYMWVFEQHRRVLVDDWSPLQLDFNFGYNYKVQDEDLTARIEASIAGNTDKIAVFEPSVPLDIEYFPVADVFVLSVFWIKLEHETIVTFYNQEMNQVMYSLFATVEDCAIENEIKCKIRDAEHSVYEAGYRGIVVQSNFLHGEDFFGGSFINYIKCSGSMMTIASKLCRLMAYRYCTKNDLPCPVEKPNFTKFDQWFSTLEDLDLMIQKEAAYE